MAIYVMHLLKSYLYLFIFMMYGGIWLCIKEHDGVVEVMWFTLIDDYLAYS